MRYGKRPADDAVPPARTGRSGSAGAMTALAGLAASAVALGLAPAVMPAGYSWVAQTTSESAAQGVPGAWVARLAFLLFGLSVILLATRCRERWGPLATGLHAAFGALMTAAAAFSHKPWSPAQPYDRTEDLLHSVAASTMGIALAIGVVSAAVWRADRRKRHSLGQGDALTQGDALGQRASGVEFSGGPGRIVRPLDVVIVAASVVLPLGMSSWPGASGVLQRLMFAIAYLWYALEALYLIRTRPVRATAKGNPSRDLGPSSARG